MRRRRPTSEVRELVVTAATELFETNGYTGTRTRDIAEHAGVTEHAIYRHFGSKAELYAVAVLTPFAGFVDAYVEDISRASAGLSLEEVVRRFVVGFLGLLREHRAALRVALAHDGDASMSRVQAGLVRRFSDTLEQTREIFAQQRDEHGLQGVDTTMTWAAMVGMMLAVVLHEDLLFADKRPNGADLVDEIVALIVHGIAHRP